MPDTGPSLPPPPVVLPTWGGQGSPGSSPGSNQWGWPLAPPSSPPAPAPSPGELPLGPGLGFLPSVSGPPATSSQEDGPVFDEPFVRAVYRPLLDVPGADGGGYNRDSMAPAPFGMTGQPGANFGGTQTGAAAPSGAVGGTSNPLLPTFPSGQSTSAFPANTAGTVPTNLAGAPTPAGAGTGSPSIGGFSLGGFNRDGFLKAFADAGYGKPLGAMLWDFLKSGAGFNPQVAQALINSLQPQVQRGEADILEQFSSMGLRNGSPAAIGLGDFLSQVNLNEEQIFAQMYEQAVQNYLGVLLAGSSKKGLPSLSGLGSLLGGGGQLLSGLSSLGGGVQPTPPTLPSNFFGG